MTDHSQRRPRPKLIPNQLRSAAEPRDADVHAAVTRLTNTFSKKLEKHAAMVSLYFIYYNSRVCISGSA